MTDSDAKIAANVQRIRQRIADAAQRSGRAAGDVTLVAVTKYVDADAARAVVRAGCQDLGESRPQQLWEKAGDLSDVPVRWHLIGHLQRNKLRRTIPLVHLLHSVDSQRLLQALDDEGQRTQRTIHALLEVNISRDSAKHGFDPADSDSLCRWLEACSYVRVMGLMGMAGIEADASATRRQFALLRELRDRCQAQLGQPFSELSMGMSGDFEIAIEEGATIVRIGSVLYAGLDDGSS